EHAHRRLLVRNSTRCGTAWAGLPRQGAMVQPSVCRHASSIADRRAATPPGPTRARTSRRGGIGGVFEPVVDPPCRRAPRMRAAVVSSCANRAGSSLRRRAVASSQGRQAHRLASATHSCRPHRGVTQTGHWYSSSGVGWSCTAGSSWCGTRVTLGPMVPHGVDNPGRMTTRTRLWARTGRCGPTVVGVLRPHAVEVGAGGSLYIAGQPVDDREEWCFVAEVGVHAGHPRAGDARAFPFGELAHDLPGHILLPGGGQVTGQVGAEPVLKLGFDYG